MPKSPNHILVIRLSAMGDVAMTVPVIRALNTQYPRVKITVLTREYYKPFFRDLPNVSVFSAHLDEEHKSIKGLYKLAKQLKSKKIDAVADLHNVLRTKILKFFLSEFNFIQINKGREEKKALTTGKKFEQLKTTYQRYADVFEELGFPIDLTNPTFPEKVKLNSKLQNAIGNSKLKVIGIAPFAAHKGKMYPLDLMKQVIEELSKEYQIVLFGGGEKEIDSLSRFEESSKNVKNVAGKLSLEEQLNVISNLDVMLSMDSGNAHLAAMLGIKVITIWGVTHPFAGFAPFNHKEAASSILPETIINKIKSSI